MENKTKKLPKQKKLCDCGKKRYGNYRLCYFCLLKREREKKEAKILKAKIRKESSKRFKESERKILQKKCWSLMSEIVRRTGADWKDENRCYTCDGLFHWKELHAGHRYHGVLDFDFDNIKPQCVKCNTYIGGNLGEYERRLIKEFGMDFSNNLKRKASMFIRYETSELMELLITLQETLDKLITLC